MRAARFEQYLRDLLLGSANPAIKDVVTFADAGHKASPYGLQVTFTTGARILLQIVRTSAQGGESADKPEVVKTGDAPAPVPDPGFGLENDRVNVRAFEAWLAALVTNGGNPEVQEVRTFHGKTHRYGVEVAFHSGARAFVYFAHTLGPGQDVGAHPAFEAKDVI
ncbi:hypothetical protein GCM10010106_40240 [Thermopolyspora flexuosa]|uniref:Uncharacterized protein n=1 Tax=Thermopolyspora flexuosa TaxID=103836 RepID=A0A543IU91_9ACTN|nr:hypothetical protein [Thermopolyspora flexuosa]TQM74135.1 hypothetical protein FHX40_0798 [Thermopolyspora flexuosa]GGM88887.1 hypothetical protein GCM10010106_40240 [Thermopolyspora flexuosa]